MNGGNGYLEVGCHRIGNTKCGVPDKINVDMEHN